MRKDYTYRDLDLSFDPHPITGDLVPVNNEHAIVRSLYLLIMTNHYERPFNPELGSNIRQSLFENLEPHTAITIRRFVEETITKFEPRVKILNLSVTADYDNNGYNVGLDFQLVTQQTNFSINFLLEKIR